MNEMEKIPDWQNRTALLLGEENLNRLRAAHVFIAGLGGVGGIAAELICRAGVGRMTIADGDLIEDSNRNRQLVALSGTAGKAKAEVLGERLLDINPELRISHSKDSGKYRYILSEPFSYASVLKEQIMIQKYKFISYYNALTAIGVLVVLLFTVPTAYFLLRGIWQGAIAFLTVALVVAVPIFIYAVTRMNSYKNLLDKGRNRKLNKAVTTVFVSTAYWFVMIEISMLYLFTASSLVSLKVAIPVMVAIVFTLYIIYLSVSIAIERKRSKNLRS